MLTLSWPNLRAVVHTVLQYIPMHAQRERIPRGISRAHAHTARTHAVARVLMLALARMHARAAVGHAACAAHRSL